MRSRARLERRSSSATDLRRPCTPPHPAKSAPHHRDFAGTPGPRFPGDPGTAISRGPRDLAARLLRSSLTHDEWARSGPRRRTTFLGHLAAESLADYLTDALVRPQVVRHRRRAAVRLQQVGPLHDHHQVHAVLE